MGDASFKDRLKLTLALTVCGAIIGAIIGSSGGDSLYDAIAGGIIGGAVSVLDLLMILGCFAGPVFFVVCLAIYGFFKLREHPTFAGWALSISSGIGVLIGVNINGYNVTIGRRVRNAIIGMVCGIFFAGVLTGLAALGGGHEGPEPPQIQLPPSLPPLPPDLNPPV